GEAGAAQPHYVETKYTIAFCCDYERRKIFAEGGTALHHYQSSNVHELMKSRSTAKKCAIINADITGQQTIVRDDDIVSDQAIVAYVRSGHQKIVVADFRRGSFGRAAMNCAVLADYVGVSDLDSCFSFRRE